MITAQPTQRHCLAVLVTDEPGVLARVVGLFSGRGYNIESLTVARVDDGKQAGLSRITIVTSGTETVIEQICAQLGRLVPVKRVTDLTRAGKHVEREMALIKINGMGMDRIEAMRLAEVFRARVIDATTQSLTIEITGTAEKLDSFIELMKPIGLAEIVRTGVAAIARGAEAFTEVEAGEKIA